MTEQELIARLREEALIKAGSGLNNGCVDCSLLGVLADEAADMIETLRTQLEKAREVKPLEWGGKQEAPRLTAPGYHISAKSELGVYRIDYFEAGHVKGAPFLVTTPDGRAIRNIERIDDAKDRAQADYQRRYNAMSQERE